MKRRICVVGAGVIGLASAVNVQKLIPSAEVTIIADKFTKETTSDGAAGLFLPRETAVKSDPPHHVRQWTRDSSEFFNRLYTSGQDGDAGLSILSGYIFTDNDLSNVLFKEFILSFRSLSPSEAKLLGMDGRRGYFVTTYIVEPRFFMPWLMTRFKENGGKVINGKVNSFEQLVGSYDVVINCAGLASERLCNDGKMFVTRGQTIRLKAPWIKHFFYDLDGHGIHIAVIPGRETVTVVGVKIKDSRDTSIRPEVRETIMTDAVKRIPSLKNAPIAWEWTGVRPHRESVRLEIDQVVCKGGKLPVVHNYGHGSNGIALSWGCGVHAATLAASHLLHHKL